MTDDSRSAYDKFPGVPQGRYGSSHYDRLTALQNRATQALAAENWPAAQAYAPLLIAEGQENSHVSIHWDGWEDFVIAVSARIAPDLRRISDVIDRLDR
jgi:hypothetical protein